MCAPIPLAFWLLREHGNLRHIMHDDGVLPIGLPPHSGSKRSHFAQTQRQQLATLFGAQLAPQVLGALDQQILVAQVAVRLLDAAQRVVAAAAGCNERGHSVLWIAALRP